MKKFALALALLAAIGCGNHPSAPAPIAQPAPVVAPEPPPAPPAPPAPPVEPPREAQRPTPPPPPAIPAETVAIMNSLGVCSPTLPGYAGADCDGDGHPNSVDICPSEDADGEDGHELDPDPRRERRGCPQADRDHDGWGDQIDWCPDQPAGEHSNHGCPDSDSDGDGVYDHGENADRCRNIPVHSQNHPNAPAADEDNHGCPSGATVDPDSDGDGVRDYEDVCPNEDKGDTPDPSRSRLGCPAGDDDRDGVLNHNDWCPRTPVRSDNTSTSPEPNPLWPGCPVHTDRDSGQASTSTSAPVVATIAHAALPTNMVAASRVATTLGDRTSTVSRLCAPRNVAQLQSATGACAANESYCYRLTPNATLAPCNQNNPTAGCVMAAQVIDPCVPGAESVVAIQCGESLIGCTPENVATVAAREGQRQPRERTASRNGRSRGRAPHLFIRWGGNSFGW